MESTGNQYKLRNRPYFITPEVHNIFHEAENISCPGHKIGDIAPGECGYH